ncbi:hypothetical protein BJ944DRAFT_272093 [Cunninghamella echinulata]|nr:hypothetical protein BJ944DRAFT_272093 [Cunninghamella echinulata]
MLTKEMIIEAIKNMPPEDLQDISKACEERVFNVESNNEKEYKVFGAKYKLLISGYNSKLKVLAVKTLNKTIGMSLIEAKRLLDRVDYEKCYITNPNGELYFKSSEANDIKTKLEEGGIEVDIYLL